MHAQKAVLRVLLANDGDVVIAAARDHMAQTTKQG
jgi:hypothetical protein